MDSHKHARLTSNVEPCWSAECRIGQLGALNGLMAYPCAMKRTILNLQLAYSVTFADRNNSSGLSGDASKPKFR